MGTDRRIARERGSGKGGRQERQGGRRKGEGGREEKGIWDWEFGIWKSKGRARGETRKGRKGHLGLRIWDLEIERQGKRRKAEGKKRAFGIGKLGFGIWKTRPKAEPLKGGLRSGRGSHRPRGLRGSGAPPAEGLVGEGLRALPVFAADGGRPPEAGRRGKALHAGPEGESAPRTGPGGAKRMALEWRASTGAGGSSSA